jgi:acylphosphatase
MFVKGQVQGVGFRWWVARQASLLGIDGSVRNLPDGSVEIVASGNDEALGAFVSLCRQGPSGAQVESVLTGVCESMVEKGFRIARSI